MPQAGQNMSHILSPPNSRSRKLGIVIKLEDGWSDEYQGIIVARILEQLQYDDKELIEQLKKTYNTKIYNDCKDEVGPIR